MKTILTVLALALAVVVPGLSVAAPALDPQNTLIMDTTKGQVVISSVPTSRRTMLRASRR